MQRLSWNAKPPGTALSQDVSKQLSSHYCPLPKELNIMPEQSHCLKDIPLHLNSQLKKPFHPWVNLFHYLEVRFAAFLLRGTSGRWLSLCAFPRFSYKHGSSLGNTCSETLQAKTTPVIHHGGSGIKPSPV